MLNLIRSEILLHSNYFKINAEKSIVVEGCVNFTMVKNINIFSIINIFNTKNIYIHMNYLYLCYYSSFIIENYYFIENEQKLINNSWFVMNGKTNSSKIYFFSFLNFKF